MNTGNIHTPHTNLFLSAQRVQKSRKSSLNNMDSNDHYFFEELDTPKFSKLQRRLDNIQREHENGYNTRLNPHLAVVITASNDRHPNTAADAKFAAETYRHVHWIK